MQEKIVNSKGVSPKSRYLLGRLLKLVAVILFVVGCGMFGLRFGLRDEFKTSGIDLYSVLLTSLSFMFLGLSVTLYHHGKKLAAPTAEEAMLRDARPPVLYLRSFLDDKTTSVERKGLVPVGFLIAEFNKTEEEILATLLSKIGPCVAIGQPKEKLPELGMARKQIDQDQDWRIAVQDLMVRARAVVIRVADTENVWWEMETAAKCVKPERLLFLLPFEPDAGRSNLLGLGQSSPQGYERFRQRFEKHIPCRLPPLHATQIVECSFNGVLFFDSDWTPRVIAFNGIHQTTKGLLKKYFKPILARFKKAN